MSLETHNPDHRSPSEDEAASPVQIGKQVEPSETQASEKEASENVEVNKNGKIDSPDSEIPLNGNGSLQILNNTTEISGSENKDEVPDEETKYAEKEAGKVSAQANDVKSAPLEEVSSKSETIQTENGSSSVEDEKPAPIEKPQNPNASSSESNPATNQLPEISLSVTDSGTATPANRSRDVLITSPAKKTSIDLTARRHAHAVVDNSQIFKKTFELILASKEAKKNDKLKTATQNAIDSLNNSQSRDPHVLFEALKITCETSNNDLKSKAVDLFAKLFDYASFDEEEDRVRLTDASVEVISLCFEGEGTDSEVEMQVARALMHSILLMPTHGASLLKAVRQIYNIFIFSLLPRNQAVAQGTLTQVIGAIFARVNEAAKIHISQLSSNVNLDGDDTGGTEEKMTLAKLEDLSNSKESDWVSEANMATEQDEDLAVKDAFLIFRAMCKLSVKELETENIDMRSHSVRSKLLSLHIIHTILKEHIDIFLSKSVVILSSSSDDLTRLLDAVRTYLVQALIKNAASPLAPVFELTLEIFWMLNSNLRSDFKLEISVLWEQIYLPVAEIRTSTPHQKRYLLSIIERLCNDSRCIIEFYLNYDCDSNQPNICEKVIDYLTKLSLARVEVTAAQKQAFRDNKRKRIATYDVSKIANLTSSSMSLKPPDPEMYALFPLDYAMKLTSLGCLVAFLRSLYSWAQKGLTPKVHPENGRSHGASGDSNSLSKLNSRNPSFVGSNTDAVEADNPEQFENLKQRKKTFLEGVRQFNVKPKKGIEFFVQHGFIKSMEPAEIATFILETDALDKAAIGEYLGEGNETNIAIMHAFVDKMDFTKLSFTESMRTFLQSFRLPGEAQKIDRYMLKFAERYVLGNPNLFANADTAYVLAYSTVMLNTDQHSPQVKIRMTPDNFVMNNAGIDDGKDLPREFLEGIFHEIQSNEIKLQSEQHAALLAGDPRAVSAGNSGFFGGRDLDREAYMHASKEMSSKTEQLVKSLGKKMRGDESARAAVFHAASHVHHVKSIFDTMWMSILAGLTAPFKEYEEADVTNLCLEGIKISIKIACMFDLEYAKGSFVRALVQFQNLNNVEEIKPKNVAAIYIMLDVALTEGNNLLNAWRDILTSISQLERLQLIAQGVDQDSIPDVSIAKLVNRKSIESISATPTSNFFGFASTTTASQSAALKFHNQQLSQEGIALLARTELSVSIDKVFTASADLSGESIKEFVGALSQVAMEEIESSGSSANPRMFSLQKVVDICYYNMGRIRLEWSQLWSIMGETFNKVGCNSNVAVAYFAVDSLRQLSMRFLNIDELAHFKFQKEFLKPFEYIVGHNSSLEVKEMCLECINNMILAKASQIKSGWKTIFGVLTLAAKEKNDILVTKAYEMAFNINQEFHDEVRSQESFADLISCFTEFAKNERFQKVGLLSLEVLSKIIIQVAKYTVELDPSSVTESGKSERFEALNKAWLPVLEGFHAIIITGEELEVRSRALTTFFDVLLKYGDHFEKDFWKVVYQKLLSPIFAVLASPWELKYDDESVGISGGESDKLSFWISTTFIQALNSMVSLFSSYFEALTPMLDDFFGLLINCICQENDIIARTGKSCFQDFAVLNALKFDAENWNSLTRTFQSLFDQTTARELFELDPLKGPVSSPTEDSGAGKLGTDKSSIVVKCVLQLLMIEAVLEITNKSTFYDAIPQLELVKIAELLLTSYKFAKTFNDDYDLRVRLWNAGVIERLPNLLKQESMSSAVYLNIMFRLYCDDHKIKDKETKLAIIKQAVPLCETIVERFSNLDDSNQQKSISTWKTVVVEIYQGYVELDDEDFDHFAPAMYRLSVRLLNRNMSAELRQGMLMFFTRVGDNFVKAS